MGEINFVNFNQDFTCICVGTGNGYKVYYCDPFGRSFSKSEGGIGVVEMLFSTSLVAVVGMGDQPALSPRRLKIINTKRQMTICELTFPTAVLKVMLNRKRLVVLLEEQIYIYDIANMKLLHTIETSPNCGAICALAPSSENCYLVYPSSVPQINPLSLPAHAPTNGPGSASSPSRKGEVTIYDALSLQPVNVVEAHKSPLSIVALNSEGTLMATASDKGTIIRIFSVPSGTKLYQFRRGTYPAKVFSINFNLSSSMIAVSSATETVHIFKLTGPGGGTTTSTNASISSGNADSDSPDGGSIDQPEPSEGSENNNGNRLLPRQVTPSMGMDAYIESKNKSNVAGLLRRSSQSLGRHVAGAVGGYLPNAVTEMWEPKERDFAFIKLPAQAGTKSVVALSSVSPHHVMVVTSEGYFYQYTIDLERGGECELDKQYSLLDSGDE